MRYIGPTHKSLDEQVKNDFRCLPSPDNLKIHPLDFVLLLQYINCHKKLFEERSATRTAHNNKRAQSLSPMTSRVGLVFAADEQFVTG